MTAPHPMHPPTGRPLISRQWRGLARPADADRYVEHLRADTLPQLRAIPGFVDGSILRRDVDEGVEFLVVTRWTSIEAIQAFAGRDAERAVVPDAVQAMMRDYDRTVRHYHIVE
jgi:heme-degrading monooxygenase HmoA